MLPIHNSYGSFSLVNGVWTYSLDQATVQNLDAGDSVQDVISFTASDGSIQQVTVNINGVDDGSVIGGTSVATITEDSSSATGTLMISDVDSDDAPVFADVANTIGDNGYGSFSLVNGVWSYALDQATVQDLDVGDSVQDVISFTASDGSVQQVTVNINGANDDSVIGGTSVATLTEDSSSVTGTLTISDVDSDDAPVFADVANTIGDNSYGSFSLVNGVWTYALNQATVQDLDAGDLVQDVISFTASDGSIQQVTVNINGVDDGSVIGGTSIAMLTEDSVNATGSLTISDVDSDDAPIFADVANTAGENGYGTFNLVNGVWAYSLDQATVQNLDAGDSVQDVISFTASDGSIQQVTVNINGVDDGSVIGGTSVVTLTEDSVNATGTLTISDVDSDDAPIFNDVSSTVGDNSYGSFSLVNGVWTYSLDQATVQDLDAGDSVQDVISFTASDGSIQQVTVNINGVDDGSVIGGTSIATLTEDNNSATGTLTISDVDSDDAPVFADVANTLGDNSYGTFNLVNGAWTYSLDQATVQNLDAGDSVQDTINFTASDGSIQQVTVNINGVDDGSVIGGNSVATITEDSNSATGTLTISDVDSDDAPVFADVANTAGENGYGTFNLVNGVWTYSLDQVSVQSLDLGDSVQDTITFTASDGNIQQVSVTINGAEDAALIGGAFTSSITEDVNIPATGILTINDPDQNEASFIAQTNLFSLYGTFSISSDGGWSYSLDNTNNSVQALAQGVTLSDIITVTTAGGDTQDITVTINGTDDAAIISVSATDVDVVEDSANTATGTISVNDVDGVNTVTAIASYGSVVISGGIWTYSVNNANGTVNALAVGATLVDTITFTAADGVTETQTITITGADDAADITVDLHTDSDLIENTISDVVQGNISVSDVDGGGDSNFTIIANYGTVALNGNIWTYTLNNSNATVEALATGSVLVDTITFTASDGTIHTEFVNITGTNDAPVVQQDSISLDNNAIASSINVLANDSDNEGEALTVTNVEFVTSLASENQVFYLSSSSLSSLANGTDISSWSDSSSSSNDATTGSSNPVYDSAAFSGAGGVSFSAGNTGLNINSNSEINLDIFTNKTIAIALQTGSDISGTQVIYEQGGGGNGYSLMIHNSRLYGLAWTNSGNPAGTYVVDLGEVLENTTYSTVMVHNGTDGLFQGYLNGDLVNEAIGIGEIPAHSGDISIGYSDRVTRLIDGTNTSGGGNYFNGSVGEISQWNSAHDQYQVLRTTQHFANEVGALGGFGNVTINSDNSLSYDPSGAFDYLEEGASEDVSINYTASDGTSTSTTRLTITVNEANDTPIVENEIFTVGEYGELTNLDLLSNNTNIEGDSLSITNIEINAYLPLDDIIFHIDNRNITAQDEANVFSLRESILGNVLYSEEGPLATFEQDAFNGTGGLDLTAANSGYNISGGHDLNTADSYNEKTFAVGFQTSSDITSSQVVFGQGTNDDGYSIMIQNGHLYGMGWTTTGSNPGTYVVDLGEISVNTVYTSVLVHDGEIGELRGYLDGSLIDITTGIGTVSGTSVYHVGNPSVGYSSDGTRLIDGTEVTGSGQYFNGFIGQVISWNVALNNSQAQNVDQYIDNHFGDNSFGTVTVNSDDTINYTPGTFDLDDGESEVVNVYYEVTDGVSGQTTSNNAIITVTDGNDAPVITLSNLVTNLDESVDVGSNVKVADINITDDASGVNIVSITGTDSSYFTVVGTELFLLANINGLNYDTKSSYDINLTVDDSTIGGSYEASVSYNLVINDVDNAPVIIDSSFSIAENDATGAVVGTVQANDIDGDTLIYSFAENGDAGGRFAINSNTGEITLANDSLINYEINRNHSINVNVSDGTNITAHNYVISVTDIADMETNEYTVLNNVDILSINTDISGDRTVTNAFIEGSLPSDNQAFYLNSSSLSNLADNDIITSWLDSSGTSHNAIGTSIEPVYNNSLFSGAGGVDFSGGNVGFDLPNHDDINTASSYAAKTIAVAFQTGNLIESEQIIYKQGDLYSGSLQLGIKDLNEDGTANLYGSISQFSPQILEYVDFGEININTAYSVALVYDGDGGELRAYLNGSLVSVVTEVVDSISGSNSDATIGYTDSFLITPVTGGSTLLYPNSAYFNGAISEISTWNDALTSEEVTLVSQHFNNQIGLGSLLGDIIVNSDNTITYDPNGMISLGEGEQTELDITYNVQNANGDVDVETVSITVYDGNEAATAISLSNVTTSIAENAIVTAMKVADINIVDDAQGINNLILEGIGSESFEIIGTELFIRAGTILNYEAISSYDLTIRVEDLGITEATPISVNYNLTVTDVNEVPNIVLGNVISSIAEITDTTSRVKVADISIGDELGINVFSLVGSDASSFEIIGRELFLVAGTSLDFDIKANYDVTIQVDDSTIGVNNSIESSINFSLQVNSTPIAMDDVAIINENMTTVISPLTNDTDANSDSLSVTNAYIEAVLPTSGLVFHFKDFANNLALDNQEDNDIIFSWNSGVGGNYVDAVLANLGGGAPSLRYDADGFEGRGGIDFVSGGNGFAISDNVSINTENAYNNKSFAVGFRTGNSVSNTEVLYEQGDGTAGYSLIIHGGNLYGLAWTSEGGSAGTYSVNLGAVQANTDYSAVVVHDGTAELLQGFLNGNLVDTATGIGEISAHAGDIGIGYMNDGTRLPDGTEVTGNGNYFTGIFGDLLSWNDSLTVFEALNVSQYLANELGTEDSLGVVTVNNDNTVTYDPQGSLDYLTGTESEIVNISYTVSDGVESDIGNIAVTVNGINQIAPIVIDLDGDGVEYSQLSESEVYFDVDGDGEREHTAWVGADDALLVYDYNNDNNITNVDEISFVQYLAGAETDLEGLQAFDDDGNMVLNADDSAWSYFKLWQDADLDGVSDEGELFTLSDLGIVEIGLQGNGVHNIYGDIEEFSTATYTNEDGTMGVLGDAAFTYENSNISSNIGEVIDDIGLEIEENSISEIVDIYSGESGDIVNNSNVVHLDISDEEESESQDMVASGIYENSQDLIDSIVGVSEISNM